MRAYPGGSEHWCNNDTHTVNNAGGSISGLLGASDYPIPGYYDHTHNYNENLNTTKMKAYLSYPDLYDFRPLRGSPLVD